MNPGPLSTVQPMSPHSPYKTPRRSKPWVIYANLFELSGVVKFWNHKKRSRLNQQDRSDQLRLMTLAGALHGGGQSFLTINLEGRSPDRVIENITDALSRTGWERRYVMVDVPETAEMHDHIHVILFGTGPGTDARRKLNEIAKRENLQHPNRADVRHVRSLPGLVSYLYGRNIKRDGGRPTSDKRTRTEAEALSGLSPVKLWKAMRNSLPADKRAKWPELPPILEDRSECEAQIPTGRKRAIIVTGESGSVPAGTLPASTATALSEARERDFESLAVGMPGEGAFDLLDAISNDSLP